METIGLLTTDTADLAEIDRDTPVLVRGLAEAGFRVEAPVWHDPAVDWAAFDLLVVRSPWDYPERYAEFTGWLARAAGRTRILNAPDLIRWNIDKRYLDDFRDLDVPVVPYAFCDTPAAAEAAIGELAHGRVIVKPTVSAASRDTGLFQPDDPRARELAARIIAAGKTAMVQPAVEEVISHGVLIPWTSITWSHGDAEIECTLDALHHGMRRVRAALESGNVDASFEGEAVRPVFRAYNRSRP